MEPFPHVLKPDWQAVYKVVKIGRNWYPAPIKSVIPLLPGYKFWIPIRRSLLADQLFVRPCWKPRNNPDYLRVEVVQVEGDELLLRRLKPPLKLRRVKRAKRNIGD